MTSDPAASQVIEHPTLLHSAPAVVAGRLIFTSGVVPLKPGTSELVTRYDEIEADGRVLATGMMSVDGWIEGVASQAWQTYNNLDRLLVGYGSSLDDALMMHLYSRQMYHHIAQNAVRSKIFEPHAAPPNTGLQVQGNPLGALFHGRVISLANTEDRWQRRVIKSDSFAPVSHYEIGVEAGPLLWFGDFIPADAQNQRVITSFRDVMGVPETLERDCRLGGPTAETVMAQAWYVLQSIKVVLAEEGRDLSDILRLEVYVVDREDLCAYERVHRAVFEGLSPVVAFTVAEHLGRPEFRVAIELLVLGKDGEAGNYDGGFKYQPEFVKTGEHSALGGCSSEAVITGPYVFLTTVAGRLISRVGSEREPADGVMPEGLLASTGPVAINHLAQPIVEEAWSAIEQSASILSAAGASLSDVVSLDVHLSNLWMTPSLDYVLRHAFGSHLPAVTMIETQSMAVAGARCSMTMIAMRTE